MGVLCLVLVLLCGAWCPLLFCNRHGEEERAGCFTLIVCLMSFDGLRSVALLRGTVVWSAVCD